MTLAIANLRVQTLTRRINKCNLQMTLLAQQQQTLSNTSYAIGKEYKQLYAYINGTYGTISAEQQDSFTSKLEQLEPIYYMINEKDTEIDEELKSLNTQLTALTKELEQAEKLVESSAKKEIPKLSI